MMVYTVYFFYDKDFDSPKEFENRIIEIFNNYNKTNQNFK